MRRTLSIIGLTAILVPMTAGCTERQAKQVDAAVDQGQEYLEASKPLTDALAATWEPLAYVVSGIGVAFGAWEKFRAETYRGAFRDSNTPGANAPKTKHLLGKEGLEVKESA